MLVGVDPVAEGHGVSIRCVIQPWREVAARSWDPFPVSSCPAAGPRMQPSVRHACCADTFGRRRAVARLGCAIAEQRRGSSRVLLLLVLLPEAGL